MNEQKPTPKTKEQLISLMKQQLENVQDEINSMQQTLESQRKKRKQLTSQLEQKEKKIQQLIENQAKTLGDKVHEGLYNTLEVANKMRADAEAQVRILLEDNSALNEKITLKDTNVMDNRKQIQLFQKKISVLEQKKTDAQRKQDNLLEKKQQLRKNVEMMKRQFDRIDRQEKQLRNHIENTKKLRLYLNKHLEGTVKINNNNANTNSVRGKSSNVDNFWNS